MSDFDSGVVHVEGTTPVSGAVTVTGEVEIKNDTGNPVPVSGTLTTTPSGTQDVSLVATSVTQPVSGTVTVSNFPGTQNVAVTSSIEVEVKNDTGSPVPISGTITANAGTGPFPVSDNGGSLTVDGVFFQTTQPISVTTLPLPSGAATSALQTQPGVDIGDVTVNNASGGAAVNIQDGGNSITVDGTLATTFPTSGTSILSNVSASVSSVTLLASNAGRKMATIWNDSASRLLVKLGTTASATSATVPLASQGYYELPLPIYTGQIDGIWDVAVGSARITELS